MLNLDDLASDRGGNFVDVCGSPLKRVPDEDDRGCDDDPLSLHRRSCIKTSTVGSQSVTLPWEIDLASSAGSGFQPRHRHDHAPGSTGIDRPCSTHEASFAILGDGISSTSSMGFGILSRVSARADCSLRCCRVGYALVAVAMLLCIATHVVGLLVYFTSWYRHSVQLAIFERIYASFSQSGFEHSVNAKRDAVAAVYVLTVGMVPSFIAAFLWFSLSSRRELRRMIQTPRLMRRKPALSSQGIPVYIGATWGDLLLLVVVVGSNGFIFFASLSRFNTDQSSPNDQAWSRVGRAYAFIAVFNLVWLLLFLPKPSAWTVYVDFFGMGNETRTRTKYLDVLGLLAVASSVLHALCMIIQFQFRGKSTLELFPDSGSIVLGTTALVAMLFVTAVHALGPRLPRPLALFLPLFGRLIFLLALCVHYPITLAWLLPTLVPHLIQRAAAWTHSRYPVELVDIAPLPNGITRLVLKRGADKGMLRGTHFTAGQSVAIRLPQASSMEWQQCTVATSPMRHPSIFTVYIHPPFATSDAADKVMARAFHVARSFHDAAKVAHASKQPPIVYVDGFYGPSHPIFYEQYSCVVLIADGMGVVQVMAILEQLYEEALQTASVSPNSKAFQRESGSNTDGGGGDNDLPSQFDRQVWFLWTCDDVCLFTEFEDLFCRIKTLDPHEIHFRLRFFLVKMPRHSDLRYQRLPSAPFAGESLDPTMLKSATHSVLLTSAKSTISSRRPNLLRPQNRCEFDAWSSRPFQQSLRGVFGRMMALVLVTATAVPLTILTIWFALRTRANAAFPIAGLLRNVTLLLLTCVVVAATVAFVIDGISRCKQAGEEGSDKDEIHEIQTTSLTGSAPPGGLVKLHSMTRMVGDANEEASERGSSDQVELLAIGSDVIDRLRIYSMRPDIDKFLRRVGRSFPRFAGTIGVFASGPETLMDLVKTSALACEASMGDWHDVDADLDFHWLE